MDYTEMDINPMLVLGLQDDNDGLELGMLNVTNIGIFTYAIGVDYT